VVVVVVPGIPDVDVVVVEEDVVVVVAKLNVTLFVQTPVEVIVTSVAVSSILTSYPAVNWAVEAVDGVTTPGLVVKVNGPKFVPIKPDGKVIVTVFIFYLHFIIYSSI
jgi:hypothetical protein